MGKSAIAPVPLNDIVFPAYSSGSDVEEAEWSDLHQAPVQGPALRSTSLPNVVKWQSVQTVTSGEGLMSSVKEVACFWIVVETCCSVLYFGFAVQ